jgi:cytoskeletal protein RodZ
MDETLGTRLRQARQARHLSLEQAAYTTHIRQRYIEALEADETTPFPSEAQRRGFLRAYAEYLKVPETLPPEPPAAAEPAPSADDVVSAVGAQVLSNLPLPASLKPRPPVSAAPEGSAEAIFAELGARLRQQRDLLSLSTDDVERQTHLRLHYIEALEAGRLDDLPSPVQGRGMLKNYASFLGLDAEALLLRYAEGLQARRAARQAAILPQRRPRAAQKMINPPSPLRALFSTELVLSAFLIVLLVGFVIWGAGRIAETRAAQHPTLTAPSIVDVLAGELTPTAASSAEQANATGVPPADLTASPDASAEVVGVANTPAALTPQIILPTAGSEAIQIYLIARERAWLRVTVDGQVAFEGRLLPGSAYPFAGNERIELLCSNAAALRVFYRQVEVGDLGGYGQIVQVAFTLQGIQTPTATALPSLTPTLPDTPTVTPTGTLQPTATATP